MPAFMSTRPLARALMRTTGLFGNGPRPDARVLKEVGSQAPLPSGRAARNGTPSPRPCLPAPNPSHFPKSRSFPFVSNYYPYWPPADHLLLGLRLLAPRTVEHEDFRQPAEMRDRLDELHRLSAVGTQGRSRCIGQHK
jgi:hypothetical protein